MVGMDKTIRGGDACAIARTLDALKDPWGFLVVRDALAGVTRFADFRASLGIATDVLTGRLNALVDAGVLRRERYQDPGSRPRTSYHLTEAGLDLKVVIGALQQWGDAHVPPPCGPTVERRDRRTAAPVQVAFVNDKGRRIRDDDAEFVRTAAYPAG
jgi:DNA-binding HxlR family transcriptional regulator